MTLFNGGLGFHLFLSNSMGHGHKHIAHYDLKKILWSIILLK